MNKRAFALAAHPDDIEFLMAGTLILLRRAGYQIHTMTIANGSCGTAHQSQAAIVHIRREEARAAAAFIGAVYHESLVDDIEIFYEKGLLARVGAIMREIAPEILLLHSPIDYMEDHQNAARLGVTAAFCRSMSNFVTDPPRNPVEEDVTVYHAQPHGNRDPFRHVVIPEIYVDVSRVIHEKREMLAHHQSQQVWLDQTQGMGAYLSVMEELSSEVGAMSGRFAYAEGWRRRSHLGFCEESADPLSAAVSEYAFVPAAKQQ